MMFATMFAPTTASLLPAATLIVCFLGALASLIFDRPEKSGEGGAKTSLASRIGIVVQSLGFAGVGIGIRQATLYLDADAFARTALVVLLFAAFIAVFRSARAALGANWSFVARMREEHGLVTSGPFAYVRHPIYAGLFLLLLAIAVGLGTWHNLLIAFPLFAVGTGIRVAEEERLLRAQFGAAYDDYAARVKRFVPGVF